MFTVKLTAISIAAKWLRCSRSQSIGYFTDFRLNHIPIDAAIIPPAAAKTNVEINCGKVIEKNH